MNIGLRPVPPALRTRLDGLKYTPAISIVHELLHIDGGPLSLVVIGSPKDITFEWVLLRDDQHRIDRPARVGLENQTVATHSDAGYGTAALALRDGLIASLGAPSDIADLVAQGAAA